MHNVFHEYLSNTAKFDANHEFHVKHKEFQVDNDENISLIKSNQELLFVYTEKELSYQIMGLQEGYNKAFQTISNINEDDLFKAILNKGQLVIDNDEIQEFISKKKNLNAVTQFNRAGPKRR